MAYLDNEKHGRWSRSWPFCADEQQIRGLDRDTSSKGRFGETGGADGAETVLVRSMVCSTAAAAAAVKANPHHVLSLFSPITHQLR